MINEKINIGTVIHSSLGPITVTGLYSDNPYGGDWEVVGNIKYEEEAYEVSFNTKYYDINFFKDPSKISLDDIGEELLYKQLNLEKNPTIENSFIMVPTPGRLSAFVRSHWNSSSDYSTLNLAKYNIHLGLRDLYIEDTVTGSEIKTEIPNLPKGSLNRSDWEWVVRSFLIDIIDNLKNTN